MGPCTRLRGAWPPGFTGWRWTKRPQADVGARGIRQSGYFAAGVGVGAATGAVVGMGGFEPATGGAGGLGL